MRKVLMEKAVPIKILIKELEELKQVETVSSLKKYNSSCKVNIFDILDEENYLIKNLYEVVEE